METVTKILNDSNTLITQENELEYGFQKGTADFYKKCGLGLLKPIAPEDIEHEIVEPKQLPPIDNEK